MNENINIFTLPNGIRIVHLNCTARAAYCGLTINAGTRNELNNEHGLAHLLEHMLFKGTAKRKAYHINNRLESVGGELNAFTTKEETVIHATVLNDDLEKAIELIADIVFNSTFPEKELEKEKVVICDEIDSYLDSPSDLIFDDFEDLLFANTTLGHNTLGNKQSIQQFTSADIHKFMARTYNTHQMVFATVGQVPFEKIQRWCEKYFTVQAMHTRKSNQNQQFNQDTFNKKIRKNTFQSHCVMGNKAYGHGNPQRIALSLLTNLLGGPMSNSILNTVLREKHGLVYNIEAGYNAYSDTGAVSIYFGTAKANLNKSVDLVKNELQQLCINPLTDVQLQRAKKQFIGQLTIASESGEQQMLSLAKSLLVFNCCESTDETIARIQAITAADLLKAANDIFNPQNMSTLIYY